jgi:hypothetical protein
VSGPAISASIRRAGLAAALSTGLAACSATPSGTSPQPSARPTASAQAAKRTVVGAGWATGRFVTHDSVAQGFSVPLPEDAGWKIEDAKDSWFVATHAEATTQVVARVLTTDGLANRARCERHARDLRPLPDREGATIVEKRRVDLPDGFDTVLEVGLLPTNPGQPIAGFLLAIGGWAKRCFVYSLVTRAGGPGAEEVVGDRLALFVERSFLRVRFSSDLTPVVPREKPPIGP